MSGMIPRQVLVRPYGNHRCLTTTSDKGFANFNKFEASGDDIHKEKIPGIIEPFFDSRRRTLRVV